MKAFLAAWHFLTVIPLSRKREEELGHLKDSPSYFPMVGLLLGFFAAFFDWGVRAIFFPMVAAALVVIFLISFSGALHLDGLSDTADGFLSSRSRDRILEIMRDSHSGVMGILAIVAVFALKWAVLAELSAAHRFAVLVFVPLLGRCNILLLMNLLPYAREESGLGIIFSEKKVPISLALSYLLVGTASLFFLKAQGGIILFGSLLIGFGFAWYCFRKIKGFTGDTLGAVCELTELVVLFSALTFERA